jgi:hypothetical protein
MSQLLDLSKDFLNPDGEIAKGGRKTVRGTAAIGLVDRSDGSILYIATTGPAYPLQTVPKSNAASGTIDFLDYGRPVLVLTFIRLVRSGFGVDAVEGVA